MSQQYSLRWNNHQPNFISMFETLLTTKTLVDVTLAAEGQHLVAHKVVLSACSTYFHSLFVDNPSHHPIVILKDVTFADLRTMVDFMYYGQVNVTEEQLPQVLETAKVLKIKGLTEMPDSTSLTRSQGSSDYNSADNSLETQRQSASPCSPTRRKRRRKSSSGSINNCIGENMRNDDLEQNINLTRELPTVTLSSLPQHKRREEKIEESAQQTGEPSNINIDQLNMEANIIPQDPLSTVVLRQRRSKIFKRQSRVSPEVQEVKKQASEPAPAPSSAAPLLQKHDSYPQYKPPKAQTSDTRRLKAEQSVGSLLIRAFAVVDTSGQSRAQTSTVTASGSGADDAPQTQRASHTPAVRSGPPLSCNFCWNTVDECGRILRRKTQYHCPECRTNLCIVPCFHEYHDGPDADASAR